MTAREPQVVAVGGGKGGVGKSLIAANLGIFLATLGKKVVVVDCSLGAPNLHLFCGVPRPTRTLAEALVPTARRWPTWRCRPRCRACGSSAAPRIRRGSPTPT
jgi:MinD superfamily P-loop ATPase